MTGAAIAAEGTAAAAGVVTGGGGGGGGTPPPDTGGGGGTPPPTTPTVSISPASASGTYPGYTNLVQAIPLGGRGPYIFQWGTVSGTAFGAFPASNVDTVHFQMFDAVHRTGVMGVIIQDADGKQSPIATVPVTQN